MTDFSEGSGRAVVKTVRETFVHDGIRYFTDDKGVYSVNGEGKKVREDWAEFLAEVKVPLVKEDRVPLVKEDRVPFVKEDGEKLRYDLIPPEAMKGLAKVLTLGAKKYTPDNYKKCADLNRFIAALMRHIEAYRGGELLDPESGESHIYHAIANLSFLSFHIEKRKDL